jgi:hypothetical protein
MALCAQIVAAYDTLDKALDLAEEVRARLGTGCGPALGVQRSATLTAPRRAQLMVKAKLDVRTSR